MIIPTIVLLAMSCVGEAPWKAHETGECAAIVHLYQYRSEITGIPLRTMARRYSSPLKTQAKPWLRFLNEAGDQPRYWPKNLSWKKKYRQEWLDTLEVVKKVLDKKIPNPTPGAEHFGMRSDRKFLGKSSNLRTSGWVRMNTPGFGNVFYRRKK